MMSPPDERSCNRRASGIQQHPRRLKMKRIVLLVVLVGAVAGVGCKKKRSEEGRDTTGSQTMGSAELGSATGSAAGSAGSAAEAPKPLTADELAKHFDECWGYWNDGKYDDFKKCYTADAVSEEPGSGMPAANG